MLSRITAKNVGGVFFRHSVQLVELLVNNIKLTFADAVTNTSFTCGRLCSCHKPYNNISVDNFTVNDLTRHVISLCMSVCSNEQNLTQAHSCSYSVEILTKRNAEIRHLAPPFGARWPIGKSPCPVCRPTSSCPISVIIVISYLTVNTKSGVTSIAIYKLVSPIVKEIPP